MSFLLKAGYTATITTDALTQGSYYEPGVNVDPVAMSPSSTYVIQPNTYDTIYETTFQGEGHTLTVSFADIAALQNKALYLIAAQADNAPEVTDSDELLAVPNTIAAVNACIECLIAAGLMVGS